MNWAAEALTARWTALLVRSNETGFWAVLSAVYGLDATNGRHWKLSWVCAPYYNHALQGFSSELPRVPEPYVGA